MVDPLSEELFEVIACPLCKGNLVYTDKKDGLLCKKCNHKYPIKNSIPVLLPPKA